MKQPYKMKRKCKGCQQMTRKRGSLACSPQCYEKVGQEKGLAELTKQAQELDMGY